MNQDKQKESFENDVVPSHDMSFSTSHIAQSFLPLCVDFFSVSSPVSEMIHRTTIHGTVSVSVLSHSSLFNKISTLSSKVFDSFVTTADTSTSLPAPNPRASSLPVRSSAVSTICSLLSNNIHDSNDIDSLLKGYEQVLSSDTVLQILMNYKQLGRVRTLQFFSWAGVQMGFRFDDCVIEYMVDFLGRRKLFDDMKCLLITVSSHNGRLSCRAFSICIRFLGRQGRFRESLCLFDEMESRFKCKPDNVVYNNMLYVLCKREQSGELIDVALSIFRRIERPDVYSYSNILVGLCKFDRFDTAFEVFCEMGRTGLMPTKSCANSLISRLCSLSAKEGAVNKVRVNDSCKPYTILVPYIDSRTGAIRPAVGLFWAVYDLGLLPSAFVVIRLITELCRLGNMEEAVKILKVVEERKLTCVGEGYSIVIQTLCDRCMVDEAGHLFRRMISYELKPKLAVYNAIICMLCKLGNLDDAQAVFKMMHEKRCLPDNATYAALVHGYCEARNWRNAYSLLIEMLGLGLMPQFNTYSLVDQLLREHEQTDLSVTLERKLESEILHKHCKAGQLEAAHEKLKAMLEKGIYPPPYVRDALEHAFQKHGKSMEVRELMQRMDRSYELKETQIRIS